MAYDPQIALQINPLDYNVIFIVRDSCRYDTAVKAGLTFLSSVGPLRRALTWASYTNPAHAAFFEGRLPSVEDPPFWPFYNCRTRQI